MKTKIILATALLTSGLWADFTLEYKMPDNMKQVVQYKDAQHVKITTSSGGESGGQLIVGDKRYMVMNQGGQTRYMDIDVMMEQMRQMSGSFGDMMGTEQGHSETNTEPLFKVVKKGQSKTVAGIKGQVWTVEVDEGQGKEYMDIVVTNDDNVVDAVLKYTEVLKGFTQPGEEMEDDLSAFMNIEKGYATIAIEGMELVKYDDSKIADSVFALPAGMAVGEKSSALNSTVKKPPLCPLVGAHGNALQLSNMLKKSVNGWNLIENATCINMMKMRAENAIYQKNGAYIHVNLSINVEGENGMIAKYRTNSMKISNLQQGKIQGNRYQSALLERVGQNAMDIKLPNAILTLTATKNTKDDLARFAKSAFDLSQFVSVEKSKPTADDALKSLGAMFGGGERSANAPSNTDMQKAGELLNGLFGN